MFFKMLKVGHLFLYCKHKGLLYLCPSALISFALCLRAPPPHPAQARNIFFCLLGSLSNFHLSVFFHMAPYASNKSPLSIWQVASPSFIFLLVSHIPWKSIFLLECLSFWTTSDPEMMKRITTIPSWLLCYVNTLRKLPFRDLPSFSSYDVFWRTIINPRGRDAGRVCFVPFLTCLLDSGMSLRIWVQ